MDVHRLERDAGLNLLPAGKLTSSPLVRVAALLLPIHFLDFHRNSVLLMAVR
jgi:hypothetical protein